MKNRKNKKYCLAFCWNCYTFASKLRREVVQVIVL